MPIQVQRIIPPGDPNVRIYFSRLRLNLKEPEMMEKGCLDVDNAVASALLDIPGVWLVELHAYHATVVKAPTYTWDEIEGSILRLFASLNAPCPEE